jgi:hypothetical protein
MQFAGRDVAARKEEVGGYWKKAMDSQPMPEAIQGRIHPQIGKGVYFAKDFDPNQSPASASNLYAVPHPHNGDVIQPEARPKVEENSPVSKAKP